MLIDKGFKSGDVISLKLINGDELIARFEQENTDEVKVERALAITIGPQGLGMMPWMFLADKEQVTIKKQHVFAMAHSKKEAADQYMQARVDRCET